MAIKFEIDVFPSIFSKFVVLYIETLASSSSENDYDGGGGGGGG